jgi:hypothetical protein
MESLVREIESYDHTGRPLRFPEGWVELDCPTGDHTSQMPVEFDTRKQVAWIECECGQRVTIHAEARA